MWLQAGTAGDPSDGGRCHRIRLPSLQFFPFFGVRPRPRPPRLPIKLQEENQLPQIYPGDSVSNEVADEYASAETRNPCEPWPCGPYSQCTPVGEYAHCKCNVGYVGLPVIWKDLYIKVIGSFDNKENHLFFPINVKMLLAKLPTRMPPRRWLFQHSYLRWQQLQESM